MTYEITKEQQEKIKKWEANLPKYKKIKYEQWYMFSHSSGIGIAINVRREYTNGKVFNFDVTDYDRW